MPRLALLLSLTLLSACGAEKLAQQPDKPIDGNAGIDVAAARAERAEMLAPKEAENDAGPAIDKVEIGPDEVRIGDTLEAHAVLSAATSSFTDVEYTWYVDGQEVLGVAKGELRLDPRRVRKNQRVYVEATALDEKGRTASARSPTVFVLNSTPFITTDLSKARGLRGVRMEAEDPDGDRLTWSLSDAPPGVTIERDGTIRVREESLSEAWQGEVVVVAEDPEGARAELHIPTSVNAAVAAKVTEEQVTRTKKMRDMTDEEFLKAQEKAAEDFDTMSDEELKAWGKKAEDSLKE